MTLEFTAYSLDTGQVLYSGTASDLQALSSTETGIVPGVRHGEGWVSEGTHYPVPVKPSPHHAFNWTTKQWQDPRTLQDLKDAKWAEIRSRRDALESTSFPYLDKQIESDTKSVLRINTAVKAADYAQAHAEPFATEWRCLDNTLLALDGPAMQMMPVALARYAQSLHSHANALRERVELAQSEADLAGVNW